MRLAWPNSAASTRRPSPGKAKGRAYSRSLKGVVYVLHAFQKKSPSGIRTAQADIDLIAERLKRARQDFETNHATRPPSGKGGRS